MATVEAPATSMVSEDELISTWTGNAHFTGWYPVALSTELDEAPLLGKDFLGTRVVLYRTSAGDPVVLHGYCAHVGADLSAGEKCGDEVQCGYHHFRYGPDGRCTSVPGGGRIPPAARVASFPAAERWGIVWAFNGPEATYDLPDWPGHEGEELVVRVRRIDVPVEPWVLVANAYDFLHLRELHGLEMEIEPDDMRMLNPFVMEFDLTWDASEIGHMVNRGRNYGTNAFLSSNAIADGPELLTGQASTPTRDGRIECYMLAAAPDDRDGTIEADRAIDERLTTVEGFIDRLVSDDMPILRGLRFREGALVKGDRVLHHFVKFVSTFPRANPERLV